MFHSKSIRWGTQRRLIAYGVTRGIHRRLVGAQMVGLQSLFSGNRHGWQYGDRKEYGQREQNKKGHQHGNSRPDTAFGYNHSGNDQAPESCRHSQIPSDDGDHGNTAGENQQGNACRYQLSKVLALLLG